MEALEARQLLSLLPVTPAHPIISFDSNGVLAYHTSTEALDITATPISFFAAAGSPPRSVTGTPSVAIHVLVDNGQAVPANAGNLVGGAGGDDLAVTGDIDTNGDGVVDYSGTLLTGSVTGFGFQDSGASDLYNFTFHVTGGQLQGLWGTTNDIGVSVTSENSTFAGLFGVDFGGGAKGNIGTVPSFGGQPNIFITKTGPTFAKAGDLITYNYAVTTTISGPLEPGHGGRRQGRQRHARPHERHQPRWAPGSGRDVALQRHVHAAGHRLRTNPIINTATATGTWQNSQVTAQAQYQLNPYVLNKKLYLFYGGCKGQRGLQPAGQHAL